MYRFFKALKKTAIPNFDRESRLIKAAIVVGISSLLVAFVFMLLLVFGAPYSGQTLKYFMVPFAVHSCLALLSALLNGECFFFRRGIVLYLISKRGEFHFILDIFLHLIFACAGLFFVKDLFK